MLKLILCILQIDQVMDSDTPLTLKTHFAPNTSKYLLWEGKSLYCHFNYLHQALNSWQTHVRH